MKKISRMISMMLATALLASAAAFPAYADTKTISSVKITLDFDLEVGDDLPDIEIDDNVRVSSGARYEIADADWSSSKNREVEIGETYALKVTLAVKDSDEYRFKGTYRSSNVSVSGGTFSSASRQDSGRELMLTVRTKPVKGEYESPEDAYWRDSGLGNARWSKVDGASRYDVTLYRGSSKVYELTSYDGTSFNFYPWMTKAGTYSFKVRAVPKTGDDYASKSSWTESDEIYIAQEDVSDGSGQVDPGSAGNSSTGQVGWIKENNRWWFRYPDGSFPKNSWQYISDQWYLFDKDGWMLTGWQQVNGQYFYLNEGGNMATGWLNWNNRWYYLNPVSDGNRGMMIKGWYTINGYQYCFGADGVMLEGWNEVDGNWYYFYPGAGNKAVNTYIDGFYVDANGVWRK